MSDCCSTSNHPKSAAHKKTCPGQHRAASQKTASKKSAPKKQCSQVSQSTILHHIKQPWHWHAKDQAYYFCNHPGCEVVYFGEDNSIISQHEVRTQIGIKTPLEESLICYCFGVSYKDFSIHPEIKDFVIAQTRKQVCACEIRNPSGRCCLKDFPAQKDLLEI